LSLLAFKEDNMPPNFRVFFEEALALKPEMVALRRDFHRHPEIAFQETRTAQVVAEILNSLGMEVRTGVGKTGVVALLNGAHDGPTVLVRCDMDALPIQEENDVDYASETPGVMHACGHDAHVAIVLTVARMLASRQDKMAGRIKFVFQPAEEIVEGAKAMIADGVLETPRPDVSIGLHVWGRLETGKVAIMTGPSMAASDKWTCVVTGKGGHGASPDETRDPITTAAYIIVALQTIVSRNLSPMEVGVVSAGEIHGGHLFNIIPSRVTLKGTLRSFRSEDREMLHTRLVEVCQGTAATMGCEAQVTIKTGVPSVNNDSDVAERIRQVVAGILPEGSIVTDMRTTGAEDMSLLMDDIPGCYFFLGAGSEESSPHHNPHFDIDEDALPIGAAILAGAAASYTLVE
jgi:amidohydrolase